jgi:hypothetical protein
MNGEVGDSRFISIEQDRAFYSPEEKCGFQAGGRSFFFMNEDALTRRVFSSRD